ncbi:hypothetical protein ITI46_26120 [Streptomyces oryzae]|uniref:Uncharacterized protein n=1 Tax=Streptomyces oryzae TaxID=1434886 RepID=A0ABS3XI74_9ACTN|nr:hypothetical protein [Streptomyces oryzae]MBO8195102.1 hypothetical protein [Streptomyces oryzae]
MRFESTAVVAGGDPDAVFARGAAQLYRRGLPAEVDPDSRVAAWRVSGRGGECAGQLYVTDARPHGVRVTVAVETAPAAAARARAEIDSALAALAA